MSGGFSVLMVQSGFAPEDYRGAETFHARIMSTVSGVDEKAMAKVRLIAYPELTGMWLPLLGGRAPGSLVELAVRRILGSPLQAVRSVLGGRSLSFAFLKDWKESFHAWIEPFRELARRHECYVCPGSTFLPAFDREVATGMRRRGSRLYNTSCLINPRGKLLGFTRKVNLTRDERLLGIKPGSLGELTPYRTGLGSIGILICLDGFHDRAVEQLDRQGCRIVLMPSANPKPWGEPPRLGAAVSQEEEWLSQGLGSLIQGRENLCVSINPMSVSSVLGHEDQGRSNAFVNRDSPVRIAGPRKEIPEPYRRFTGLGAIASSHEREEAVAFEIEFDDAARETSSREE